MCSSFGRAGLSPSREIVAANCQSRASDSPFAAWDDAGFQRIWNPTDNALPVQDHWKGREMAAFAIAKTQVRRLWCRWFSSQV